MTEAGCPAAPSGARALTGVLMLLMLLGGPASCRRASTVRTPFNRGVYLYSHGNVDGAIDAFERALEEDPDDFRARFNLALCEDLRARQADRAGDSGARRAALERAAAAYRELLEERPQDVRATINLAACLDELGQEDGAESLLRDASSRFDRDPRPDAALAARLLRQAREEPASGARRQRLEEALSLLGRARSKRPAALEVNAYLGETHAMLAALDGKAGDAEAASRHVTRARERFRDALANHPDDIATLLALGRFESASGDPDAARGAYVAAVSIDPDNVEAHAALADHFESTGDLEAATRHLWRARRLDRAGEARQDRYRDRLVFLYEKLIEQEQRRQADR